MRQLAALDVSGCRRSLIRLSRRLTPSEAPDEQAAAVQLLLDVLHRVNRRVHPNGHDEANCQRRRLELILRFSDCGDIGDASRRFRAELALMLSGIAGAAQPLVARARRYIDENYHRRISLSTVASTLNVSSSHLSRAFRRETSLTLTSYIHRVRLAHARVLLAEGTRSISEIAYRVGYQTYRDFYRNFVRLERASPRVARRRLVEQRNREDAAEALSGLSS